jgi:hypothetical protein
MGVGRRGRGTGQVSIPMWIFKRSRTVRRRQTCKIIIPNIKSIFKNSRT